MSTLKVMKYKFDVLVILNDESRTDAEFNVLNQMAHAEHINKIFIGNTSLDTLQVIASKMEQSALPTVSGRRVIHSVQTKKPVILGLNDAEFNVLKDSTNPVVVIGTPDELGKPKTLELITNIQRPDKPVIEIQYVNYINLLSALEYLATLQVNFDGKHKSQLTMYKHQYQYDTSASSLAPVTRLDTNIAKSTNYRAVNRAIDAITIGIKANNQKRKTIIPIIQQFSTNKPLVKDVGYTIDNIVIVPQQLLTKLPVENWNKLLDKRLFVIVITPENARIVTDLMVDSARIPTKTVGGRIAGFFKGATDAVFGSESSRRRRRTQKQLQSTLRRTLKAGKMHIVTQDMKDKFRQNLAEAKAENKVTKQKYLATIEAGGAKQAISNAANVLKTINTAVRAQTALSPAQQRNLEIARTLTQNVDRYIKEAQADYDAKLKVFNSGVEQALAKLDSELSAAQNKTKTATQALQEHQTAHGMNNKLTQKDVQIRLNVIATESDDAIDAMIKSLVIQNKESINGILDKFDVQSIHNTAMDNKQTFQKEAHALVLEATAKVMSILHDKYKPVHVQNAVREYHDTLLKFKQDQAQTILRIQEYKTEIAARQEILAQEIPMVSSGLFEKKPNPVVAAEHKRLEAENVALASKLAFEEYKLKMYMYITQAFGILANVILEIQSKLADRLAGIPERQSKIEKLNNALRELLEIQVARKTLANTRNRAVNAEKIVQEKISKLKKGEFANSPSLVRRQKEANNAKAAIPELTPVDKQDIMLNAAQKLASNITKTQNKLGSISRKRRGAKWYQFGEKRTLKQAKATKQAELASLKRKQASIRRRQKEQVLG